MPPVVTSAELADELEIDSGRLTRWLRKESDAGNALVDGHTPGSPWRFTPEEAKELAAKFRASPSQTSDSGMQQQAERTIRIALATQLGVTLEPRTVVLDGAKVDVDAVSPDGNLMAEIFARQGALKAGQKRKVATDLLKLVTIHRERPGTQIVLAFADEAAAAFVKGSGWVAHAVRAWNVRVEVVEVSEELSGEILQAQSAQFMANSKGGKEEQ